MIKLSKNFRDPVHLLEELKSKPEVYWVRRGEKKALELFHQMAERVPAYKDFLKKNKINSGSIKTIRDFGKLPYVDKDNYLRVYPLKNLCWDGKLSEGQWTISATSGSSGDPFYFPRTGFQDWQYALTAELYLRTNFAIDKKSTLYIDGWGMGIWIGGVFSYQAVTLLAERGGYDISIVTPGSSKEEIIKAVKYLGHNFDQIIICGYPPLIKDTIDDGEKWGLNWKDYDIKFIFSAEGFSEKFRDYIAAKTGLKNIYKDTLNHYGTVDLGTMSHETPLSILIRRLSFDKQSLNEKLFGEKFRQPTLTQFMPEMFFFESVHNQVICSAFSGLPLVRYDLKDSGSVVPFHTFVEQFELEGIDLYQEANRVGIADTIYHLPFVSVFERSDFTVKLSGANIFPEEIKRALEKEEFSGMITGKFTMMIHFDDKQDQSLEINLELRPGVKVSKAFQITVLGAIIGYLSKENSEYKYLYEHLPRERVTPKLVFWEYEDPTYFRPAGKQRWKVGK